MPFPRRCSALDQPDDLVFVSLAKLDAHDAKARLGAVFDQKAARNIPRTTKPWGPPSRRAMGRRPARTARGAVSTRRCHVSAPPCNRTARCRSALWYPRRGNPAIMSQNRQESKSCRVHSGGTRDTAWATRTRPAWPTPPIACRRRRWPHGSARPQLARRARPVAQRGPTLWQPGRKNPERKSCQMEQAKGWRMRLVQPLRLTDRKVCR